MTVVNWGKVADRREKRLDDIGAQQLSAPETFEERDTYGKGQIEYISRENFEKMRDELLDYISLVNSQNIKISKRLSYIENAIHQSNSIIDMTQSSHENAKKLRTLFKLPEIQNANENSIKELKGRLKRFSTDGKTSISLIREIRGG